MTLPSKTLLNIYTGFMQIEVTLLVSIASVCDHFCLPYLPSPNINWAHWFETALSTGQAQTVSILCKFNVRVSIRRIVGICKKNFSAEHNWSLHTCNANHYY